MEQLYNAMVNYMQMPQERPAVKGGSADKDGFQKLLEQKQSAETPAAPRQERPENSTQTRDTQETQKPQGSQETQESPAAPMSEKELEERMSLAAMAMLNNPLVAEIVEETPQILTDPSWEDGLVPVGYDDNKELGIRVVHWARPLEDGGQNPEDMNAVASQWIEAEDEADAAPETQMEVPETELNSEAPEMEIKVETGKAETQDAETSDGGENPELQDAEMERPVFEDVKAAPVKVGDAPAAEKAEKPMETQIGDRLAQALQDGETQVEIQLNPENLGKVKVEMLWSKDGGLVVQLHAENRDTQSLLSKNLSGLENLLSRETQQEVRVEVPRQEESQRQDLYEQQQHQQRQQQQERRQSRHTDSEAFMQQLRLGLIPMDEN